MSEQTHEENIKKLGDLMRGIRFAMLTTAEPDGSLHSRPMATQDVEFDGDIWFFTAADSGKVWEADRNHHVNVAYSNPEKNNYVSATGTAALVRDRKKIEELWKPVYKTFFPKGLEDPELALLKISVEKAEYWDSPGTAIGRAINFARAYLTSAPSKLGDHAKVAVK